MASLPEENGAGVAEHGDDPGVPVGHLVAVGGRAPGRGDPGRVEAVLDPVRDAVEFAPVATGGQFAVGFGGLRQRVVRGDGDVAVQVGGEALDPRQVDLGEAAAGDLPRADPVGLLANRSVGDVGFVGREGSGVFGGKHDPVLLWRVGHARQPGVEGDRRLERQIARDVAELAHPGDLPADRLDQLLALLVRVGDGVELLGLGDRGGGDVGGRLGGDFGRGSTRTGGRRRLAARPGLVRAVARARVTCGKPARGERCRAGEEVPASGGRAFSG